MTLSAISKAPSNLRSISCWLMPTSWWEYSTLMPKSCSARIVSRLRVGGVPEVEVLELWAAEEVVEAHLASPLQRPAQDVSWIADVRVAIRCLDVAEHPGDRGLLRAPGEDLEGRGVGQGDHVRLLDILVARDRRAVEAHPPFQSVLELADRYREALQRPHDVREP